jgi:hypothetical protein
MLKKTIISGLLISCAIVNSFAGEVVSIKTLPLSFEKFQQPKLSLTKGMAVGMGDGLVIGVGGQVSILKLFGAGKPPLIGFGVNGLFVTEGEMNAFFGDFSYFLPKTITDSDKGYAIDYSTSPSEIDVEIKRKISAMQIRFGYRRYFMNEFSDEGFKFYIQSAFGAFLFKGTNTFSSVINPDYYTEVEPTFTAPSFFIAAGGGAEYTLSSSIGFFGEANLNIPINFINKLTDFKIPFAAQISFGARLHF